jgi:hypothetical protein
LISFFTTVLKAVVSNSLSNSISFRRILDKGGPGTSSTDKSLLEDLHTGGDWKHKWKTDSKSTECDDVSDKIFPWNEVFVRNSVRLYYKSLCRDSHGETLDHYDFVRTVICDDIDYVLCTSPRHSGAPGSEVSLSIDTSLLENTTGEVTGQVPVSGKVSERCSR